MRESEYDQYVEHKDDHERLLDDLRDMMDDCEDGPGLEAIDLSERLQSWFAQHFKQMDARRHNHL